QGVRHRSAGADTIPDAIGRVIRHRCQSGDRLPGYWRSRHGSLLDSYTPNGMGSTDERGDHPSLGVGNQFLVGLYRREAMDVCTRFGRVLFDGSACGGHGYQAALAGGPSRRFGRDVTSPYIPYVPSLRLSSNRCRRPRLGRSREGSGELASTWPFRPGTWGDGCSLSGLQLWPIWHTYG